MFYKCPMCNDSNNLFMLQPTVIFYHLSRDGSLELADNSESEDELEEDELTKVPAYADVQCRNCDHEGCAEEFQVQANKEKV